MGGQAACSGLPSSNGWSPAAPRAVAALLVLRRPARCSGACGREALTDSSKSEVRLLWLAAALSSQSGAAEVVVAGCECGWCTPGGMPEG